MSLDINSFTAFIPVCFAITMAFIYFFGRIIGDIQPKKYDKHMYYFRGVSFILCTILIPYLVIYFILESFGFYEILSSLKFNRLNLGLLCVFVVQIEFFNYISSKVSNFDMSNPHITFFGKKYNSKILIIISFMAASLNYSILYISYYMIVNSPYFELLFVAEAVFSFIVAFYTYVFLAVIYGYSSTKFPYAAAILKNGQVFSGNIVSFGEYITLVTEDMVYDINKDEICFIEKSRDNFSEASLEESNDQKDQCKLITE